jgi:hypothetical protein
LGDTLSQRGHLVGPHRPGVSARGFCIARVDASNPDLAAFAVNFRTKKISTATRRPRVLFAFFARCEMIARGTPENAFGVGSI